MKMKYDYNQDSQLIIKTKSEIDNSIIDISKGKKKNSDKIIKIVYQKGNYIVKLFGEDFIKNNRNKCKIIYNQKKNKLKTSIENEENNKKIKIKLQLLEDLSNLDFMLEVCKTLIDFKEISKLKTQKVKSMKRLFYECSSLEALSISSWNLINVTNIKEMFFGCSSLESLPDISNWDTSKIITMSYLFVGCSKLKSIPDISKWNTGNVTTISHFFDGCSQLISISDISKWDTNNFQDISLMLTKSIKLV